MASCCTMQVIQLVDCDVYSYKSDHDGDPFGEKGAMYVRAAYSAGLHVSCQALSTNFKQHLVVYISQKEVTAFAAIVAEM